MDKQVTAEELMELFKNLENEERWKFLLMMYNGYFRKGEEEINEKDIDF